MESDSEFGKNQILQGRWLKEEHERFLNGIIKYGKDWRQVEEMVKTRKGPQIRSHAQKFFLKIHQLLKDKRKTKNKTKYIETDIQLEVLNLFSQKDITQKTPIQLVAVIRKDWEIISPTRKKGGRNKTHGKERQNYCKQKYKIENEQQKADEISESQLKKNFQGMENSSKLVQEQSYFVKLLKYNKEFFANQYQEVIQFEVKQDQPHSLQQPRKVSFTLPDEDKHENTSEMLKQRIDKLHRAMESKEVQENLNF